MPTHCDVLRMIPSANAAAIKKAYYKLALTHHPDKTLHLPEMNK
jgi:curved DNA-binding protein CbpA